LKQELTKKIIVPNAQVEYNIVTNEKLEHIKVHKKMEKVNLLVVLLIDFRNLKSWRRIKSRITILFRISIGRNMIENSKEIRIRTRICLTSDTGKYMILTSFRLSI